MSLVTQSGPSSSMSREGSRTALIVQNAEQRDASALTVGRPPAGTLRLRGGPRARPHVVWDEDVVDNEGLGRKKSKICCIYHRPRRFDESSDEDSSGTESGSSDDDDNDDGGARPSGQYRHHRHHVDGERDREPRGEPEHKGRDDRDDRNAYERTSPRKGKNKSS
ncbi:phosphatase inhibitor-domain-containing protein [Russula dissimulans]|nr:phosphatase inhibitor-domain-containing protein [Russula dissimulans]